MNLSVADEGREYVVRSVELDDKELSSFLFSLGCYTGEPITVISHLRKGSIVSIKNGRYSIDAELAKSIIV